MIRVLLCALIACASTSACQAPAVRAEPVSPNASVVKVVDGDTIDVRSNTRGRLRIRIIGLDTPETKKPRYTIGCWGPQATEFAQETLAGQRIELFTDPGQDATDRYGRTLAGIILADGRNYAVEAVRLGFGRAYVYNHKPSIWAQEIADAQQQAQSASRGLWGEPCHGHVESVPLQ